MIVRDTISDLVKDGLKPWGFVVQEKSGAAPGGQYANSVAAPAVGHEVGNLSNEAVSPVCMRFAENRLRLHLKRQRVVMGCSTGNTFPELIKRGYHAFRESLDTEAATPE